MVTYRLISDKEEVAQIFVYGVKTPIFVSKIGSGYLIEELDLSSEGISSQYYVASKEAAKKYIRDQALKYKCCHPELFPAKMQPRSKPKMIGGVSID